MTDNVILYANHLISALDEHPIGVVDPLVSVAAQQLQAALDEDARDRARAERDRLASAAAMDAGRVGRSMVPADPEPLQQLAQAVLDGRVYLGTRGDGMWGVEVLPPGMRL